MSILVLTLVLRLGQGQLSLWQLREVLVHVRDGDVGQRDERLPEEQPVAHDALVLHHQLQRS